MGYVSTAQQNGLVVSATKGLLVYAVIAIPLVLVTMGTYFLFELVNRGPRSRVKQDSLEKPLEVV